MAATTVATIAGGELGILCFFESQLQEQCRFLWVSPHTPARSGPALPPLLPCSSSSSLIVGEVGRRLWWWEGGSGRGFRPRKVLGSRLAPRLPQGMTTGWRPPLSGPQCPHCPLR